MMKEAVLVAYDPSMVGTDWFDRTIEDAVFPHLDHSVLLTPHEEIPPSIRKNWDGKSIVQYKSNGERWVDGAFRSEWVNNLDKAKQTQETHAFALTIALLNAARKGYRPRSFLLLPETQQAKTIARALCDCRDSLQGLTIYTPVTVKRDDRPLVVWIDTETTGLSPAQNHTVIEIAATITDFEGRYAIDHFEARADPPTWARVESGAMSINRFYTDARWKDRIPHEAMIKKFSAWLPSRFILGGHNVSFDRNFLEDCFRRYKIPIPEWSGAPVDTMPIADKHLRKTGKIKDRKLKTVCEYYGIDTEHLHGARVDIDTTRKIYLLLRSAMV